MTDQKNNPAQEQYDNRWDYILDRETAQPAQQSAEVPTNTRPSSDSSK